MHRTPRISDARNIAFGLRALGECSTRAERQELEESKEEEEEVENEVDEDPVVDIYAYT